MRLLRLKRFWSFLLLPASLVLITLASDHPDGTEKLYSTGIYPVLAGLFGRLFSLAPFSAAQWLVILLPLALIAYSTRQIVCAVRCREERRDHLAALTATLMCIVGVGYLLFTLSCGLNYHRLSFTHYSGLDIHPSPVQELTLLCQELADRASVLRTGMAEDADGVTRSLFSSDSECAAFAQEAFGNLGEIHPILGGYAARPKPVQFSRAMSYLDITGVFTPFTYEANVNMDTSAFWIPSTMMHELAHFKGFMREDEANFIAYVACRESGSEEFDYSGTMLAMVHSTNALYSADRDAYYAVMDTLSDGVHRDLEHNRQYWKQFEGPVSQVSSAVNDVYLKSNRQASGLKSYGRMVDLLLAEYRQRMALAS